ncbi:MAG: DUF2975 domain-containing protein [Muribaculaceae bacterium]|nr:DUF2975 domain-containing protein [Muribaculaceae bacterium]
MKSINLLCVCIIALMIVSTFLPTTVVLTSYLSALGNNTGYPDAELSNLTPVEVSFNPDHEELYTPTNTLDFNGEKLPVIMYQGIVMVPSSRVPSSLIADIAVLVLTLICMILIIIEFIRLIININRGKIFESANIQYIWRLGIYLLISGALECVSGIIRESNFSSIGLKMNHYDLTSEWTIPWMTFMLGLLALLLARVWQIAKTMKEEQQLTV